MEKYFKFPSMMYPTGQLAKWYSNKNPKGLEDSEEWKESLEGGEEPFLTGRSIICNVPISGLEGCYFEPCASIENEEYEFETGLFTRSNIFTRSGDSYMVLWPVDELEQKLIEAGIVAK